MGYEFQRLPGRAWRLGRHAVSCLSICAKVALQRLRLKRQRRNQAMTWMVPACQCFHAGDLAIAEAYLWLKIRSNFPVIEGRLKVLCDVKMVLGFGGEAGRSDGGCLGGRSPKQDRSHRGTWDRGPKAVLWREDPCQRATIGHCTICQRWGFAEKSRVVLTVVRTVSG